VEHTKPHAPSQLAAHRPSPEANYILTNDNVTERGLTAK
jgi:hypothetical protein